MSLKAIQNLKAKRLNELDEQAEAAIIKFMQPFYEALEPYLRISPDFRGFEVKIPYHRTIVGEIEDRDSDPKVTYVYLKYPFFGTSERINNIADAVIKAEKRGYQRYLRRQAKQREREYYKSLRAIAEQEEHELDLNPLPPPDPTTEPEEICAEETSPPNPTTQP